MSNLSIAVFLVNPAVRGMMVAYEPESTPPTATEISKRTLFKTFDKALKVDDLVIIPTNTRQKFTVARIAAADIEVDLEHHGEVRWIAGPVDVAAYQAVLDAEQKMLDQIKAAEATHRRKELAEKLMAHADTKAIGALQIANMSDVPTVKAISASAKDEA